MLPNDDESLYARDYDPREDMPLETLYQIHSESKFLVPRIMNKYLCNQSLHRGDAATVY